MTVHVDFAVTEVVPEPEAENKEGGTDRRWADQSRVETALRRKRRLERRVAAEGFDD